jgi:hypothetical protein
LKFELTQNAWKLVDLIDWKGTPSENQSGIAKRHGIARSAALLVNADE